MRGFVLDSYALIAYFEDEPGAGDMEQILEQAEKGKAHLLISVVNWGEIYYSFYRSKGEEKAEESLLVIEQLPVEIIEIDRSLMYDAARLKAKHSIALGDCLAAALALNRDYSVVTGDRDFKKLQDQVKIEWIR
jgi:ribonuclease VapC